MSFFIVIIIIKILQEKQNIKEECETVIEFMAE